MRQYFPPVALLDWAYFLDVDGTLIEIASKPDEVCVDASLLDLIARFYRENGGALALVSGRAIADIEKLIGPLQLPIAGQHGLERRDSNGQLWKYVTSLTAKDAIKATLAPVLVRHPNLLLEDKGFALALHYRLAPHLASYAQRLMKRLAIEAGEGLEVQYGKRVAEIKPSGIDKGSVVAEYLAVSPFKGRRPVFIGDDLTDERGFAEVNKRGGISIKVGKGKSCASFRLKNVSAVRNWLGNALKENV